MPKSRALGSPWGRCGLCMAPLFWCWAWAILAASSASAARPWGPKSSACGAARACPDYADEVHTLEDLDSLLPRADVVAVTLPGTQATAGLLSRERIARMKERAVLLNVGRGTIVDTEALCDALESGRLGGAGVDVTDPAPAPGAPALAPSYGGGYPHVSGFYHLKETHERIVDIMVENLKRFQAGEPLKNQVDFSTGYRKLT